jgi:DNA-binding MarR family transcriptional regulator
MTTQLPIQAGLDSQALYGLIVEVRKLFHRMANVADRLHADLGLPAAQRAVMESLADSGPSTVPAIARRKGVTRQHIQVVMNSLEGRGFVVSLDNPAHRKSPLFDLSPMGRGAFEKARSREHRILETLAATCRVASPSQVARVLSDLGDALEETLEARFPRRKRIRPR